jgi:nucleotide-binding universal stress UspA family protein
MGQPVIVDNERCIREEVQLMKEGSAIVRFLSGSVSTKLVQHSGCPVLVVR